MGWRDIDLRRQRAKARREDHGARRAMYDDQPRSGYGQTRRADAEDSGPAEQEQRGSLWNGGANRKDSRWPDSEP